VSKDDARGILPFARYQGDVESPPTPFDERTSPFAAAAAASSLSTGSGLLEAAEGPLGKKPDSDDDDACCGKELDSVDEGGRTGGGILGRSLELENGLGGGSISKNSNSS